MSTVLRLRVVPNASRGQVVGWMDDGSLKLKVQAPPEGGQANEAVCRLLGELCGLPRGAVHLESGEKSRLKRVRLYGMNENTVKNLLSPE